MLILIPVKDMAEVLPRAVRSLLNQTCRNFQVLIMIDRDSSDGTRGVAKAMTKCTGTGIITCRVGNRAGVRELYMQGIKRARPSDGIIGILDADDELEPRAVSGVTTAFRTHPKVGFLWTQHRKIPKHRVGCSSALPRGQTLAEALCDGWWGCSHFKAFRQSVYLKSPLPLMDCQCATDMNLAMTLAATGCETMFLPSVLYRYHTGHRQRETRVRRGEQRKDARMLRKRLMKFCRQNRRKMAK